MKTFYFFLGIALFFLSACTKIDNHEDCRNNILRVLDMETSQDSCYMDNKDYLFEYTLNGHNFYYIQNVMDCEVVYYSPIDCHGNNLCSEGDESCYNPYWQNGSEIGIVGKKQ